MEGVAVMKNNINYSKEYLQYRQKKTIKTISIKIIQIAILIIFIGLWELLAQIGAIDTFTLSCPSRMWKTLMELASSGTLLTHMWVTLYEAIIGFLIVTLLGSVIAIILWWNDTLFRILEPYLVVLNSLPKIALGPILIIWIGIGTKAIVAMDVLIMIIITTLSMLNAFRTCDENKILLLKSMGANKVQILIKLILPNSLCEFISVLKINVGLTWVGTIMGEYLVSRAGLGYLIQYGGQVFDLDLVMTSTVILCLLAGLMYFIVAGVEKIVYKRRVKK